MITLIKLIVDLVLQALDIHQLLVYTGDVHRIIEIILIILKIIQCNCNKTTLNTLFLITIFINPLDEVGLSD